MQRVPAKKVSLVRRMMGSTALASFCLATLVGANSAQADSLFEAMEAAYTSNPALLAERAGQRATDEAVPQAVAGWRPTLNGQGTYGYQETETDTSGGVAQSDSRPLTGSLTLTQNIFTGGRTLYGTRQARESVKAGRESLRDVEQTTLLNAVTAFMDVLRNEALVELQEKNVKVLKRELEATEDRFRVGELTRTDVAQAEARLSLAEATFISSQVELVSSRSAYVRIVGREPGTLDAPPPLPPLPASQAEAMQIAIDNNPSLAAVRHAERAAKHAVTVAKGALLPSVSLQASYDYSDNPTAAIDRNEEASVTAVLSVPLYQGGAEYSTIRQAKQTHAQNRLNVAGTLRQVEEAVVNAWEQLRLTQASIRSNSAEVRANEIALEGVRQEFQVGSRSTLDVLNAEQELVDAQVSLVRSHRDEYVAGYSLISATGQVSAQKLDLNVPIYDPKDNYDEVSGSWIGFGNAE
jgi:outer membrane protein